MHWKEEPKTLKRC